MKSAGFRALLLAGVAGLALSGCMSKLGDTTGSLGSSQPRSESEWRSQADSYGRQYEANPSDRNAALRYATALRALDQNAQALAILQQVILKHPNDLELLGTYGRALADAGRLKEAQEVLSRAHLPERPDWRILSVQGTVADQLGEHDAARQYYLAALKIRPAEPTVLSNLGLSYALSRNLPEAERVLREAAQNPRADIRVRQNLVLVLGLQGRFGEAEKVAQQDQSPAEASRTVADLKRMVGQTNSWDLIKNGGKKPARQATATKTADQPG